MTLLNGCGFIDREIDYYESNYSLVRGEYISNDRESATFRIWDEDSPLLEYGDTFIVYAEDIRPDDVFDNAEFLSYYVVAYDRIIDTNDPVHIRAVAFWTFAPDLVDIEKTDMGLIDRLVSAVNRRDVDEYIDLFNIDNKFEMKRYVEANGRDGFFSEKREIISVYKLKDAYIESMAYSFKDVQYDFDEYTVYYVVENDTFNDDSGAGKDGIQANLYIIVTEANERKIYRISATPTIDDEYLDKIK